MIRISALLAMGTVLLDGYLFLRANKPWHIVGSATGLMLANVALFTAVSNTDSPWNGIALAMQVVVTAAAGVWIRREWVAWRSDFART